MYFTFCGRKDESSDVLCSVLCCLTRASGGWSRRHCRGKIWQKFSSSKYMFLAKRGVKKEKPNQALQSQFIYFLPMRWIAKHWFQTKRCCSCQSLRSKCAALIHSLSPQSMFVCLNLNSDSNTSAMFWIACRTSGRVTTTSTFSRNDDTKLTNASCVSPNNIESNTFNGEKPEVSDRNLAALEVELPWNPCEDELHRTLTLTQTQPDKAMTKSSRVAASQNLAWRPSRPPTPPRAHRARPPCSRDSVSPGLMHYEWQRHEQTFK